MPIDCCCRFRIHRRLRLIGLALLMAACVSGPQHVAAADGARADDAVVAPRPVPAARPDGPRLPQLQSPPPNNNAPARAHVPSQSAQPKAPLSPSHPSLRAAPAGAEFAAAAARRKTAIGGVRNWGYQLAGLDIATAAQSPYELLVVDATTGVGDGNAMTVDDVKRLKMATQGRRRLVVSYLSIGEAEDYRPDYFSTEYLEEDAPDWLMHENPQWKGNRIISFCDEGWQQTILGDENGRNVYNSIEASPLYRLVELGLDGVYLDRVDVYSEVGKTCPDAARRMVSFVKRLAEHARRRNPDFLVILQNAEELLRHRDMVETIDAIAKEDLFYGVDHSEAANGRDLVVETLDNLRLARRAGRPVFFVDYLRAPIKIADARRRGAAEGFIGYFGPRDLGTLWLPGRDY